MSDDEKSIIEDLLLEFIQQTKRSVQLTLPTLLINQTYFPYMLESMGNYVSLSKINWENLIEESDHNALTIYLNNPKLAKYLTDKLTLTKYVKNYKFVMSNLRLFHQPIEIPSTWTISQVKEFSSLAPSRIDASSIIDLVEENPHDFFFILGNLLKYAVHKVNLYNSRHELIKLLQLITEWWEHGWISEKKTFQIINDYYLALSHKDLPFGFMSHTTFGESCYFLLHNWKYLTNITSQILSDPNLIRNQFYSDNLTVLSTKTLSDQALENMVRLYDEVIQDPSESANIAKAILMGQSPKRDFDLKDETIKTIIRMLFKFQSIKTINSNLQSKLRNHLKISFGLPFYQKYPELLDKYLINKFMKESNPEHLSDLLLRMQDKLPKSWYIKCFVQESVFWTMKDKIGWYWVLKCHSFSQEFLINFIPWYYQKHGNDIANVVGTQSLGSELTSKYHKLINWNIAVTNPKIIDGDNWQYLTPDQRNSWFYNDNNTKIKKLTDFASKQPSPGGISLGIKINGNNPNQIHLSGRIKRSITFNGSKGGGSNGEVFYDQSYVRIRSNTKYESSEMSYHLKYNQFDTDPSNTITISFDIEDSYLKDGLIILKKFQSQ